MLKKLQKILLFIFLSVLLFSIIFAVSWSFYKFTIKDLLIEDADGFACLSFSNYSRNKNAQVFVEDVTSTYGEEIGKAVITANKYTKFLNNTFIIHSRENIFTPKEPDKYNVILGLDIGVLFAPLRPFIGFAFDKRNDVYVLKPNYKKMVTGFGKYNLYLKPYRGLFLFSLSETNLKNFYTKIKTSKKNAFLENNYESLKHELLFFSVNLKESFSQYIPKNNMIQKVDYCKGYIYYDTYYGKLAANVNVDAYGPLMSYIDSSKATDRPLIAYIRPDSYYVANNDFSKLVVFIGSELKNMQQPDPEDPEAEAVDYLQAANDFLKTTDTSVIETPTETDSEGVNSETTASAVSTINEAKSQKNTKVAKKIEPEVELPYAYIRKTLNLIGNELIFGMENAGAENQSFYGIIPLKNKDNARKFLEGMSGTTGQNVFTVFGQNLILKDDSLYLNRELDRLEPEVSISRETFFYTKLSLEKLVNMEALKYIYIEIDAKYHPSYNLLINVKLSKDDLRKILSN